jgi:hypothetical protein
MVMACAGDSAVMLNVAAPDTPVAVAVTVIDPGVEPMVRVTEAFPSLPVVAVEELSVAAPAGLTAKVTVAPGNAPPAVLFTWTTSGEGSAAPAGALWPLPETTWMEPAAGGGTLIVRVIVTVWVMPAALAVTVMVEVLPDDAVAGTLTRIEAEPELVSELGETVMLPAPPDALTLTGPLKPVAS